MADLHHTVPIQPPAVLDRVETTIDTLVDAGEPYQGLVPSILDRRSGAIPAASPPTVPGQRQFDRAHHGCNLLHDEPLLRTMYGLAAATDRERYEVAADRYLETFATECTDTATGLFPWGEHAYWHVGEDRIGNSRASERDDTGPVIHDHLRAVPAWLWEKLAAFNPDCVQDFADGLEYHWNDPEEPEYIRHAYITIKGRYPKGDHACDFPRHGGHYVFDWAFAYADEQHPDYLRRIEKVLDYWWDKPELHQDGLLPMESRGDNDTPDPGQTISLVVSLFEAADHLESNELAPDLRELMRERADSYLDAYLEGGDASAENRILAYPLWASVYGGAPPGATAASDALKVLCAYRQTGREPLLEWATEVGRTYRDSRFPDQGTLALADTQLDDVRGLDEDEIIPIWAFAVGSAVGLFADLYDLTGESRWLDAGLDLSETAVEQYFDAPLPRAAGGVDHYENQLGTGYLVYNLARIALLAMADTDCPLGPDYTAR